MNIDIKYTDNMVVYKWGRANDLVRRAGEHVTTFKQLNIEPKLVRYNYIDPQYISTAEKNLKNAIIGFGFHFIFEAMKMNELTILNKKNLQMVEEQYDQISKSFIGHNAELISRIKDLEANTRETELKASLREAELNSCIREVELKANTREAELNSCIREVDFKASTREAELTSTLEKERLEHQIQSLNQKVKEQEFKNKIKELEAKNNSKNKESNNLTSNEKLCDEFINEYFEIGDIDNRCKASDISEKMAIWQKKKRIDTNNKNFMGPSKSILYKRFEYYQCIYKYSMRFSGENNTSGFSGLKLK